MNVHPDVTAWFARLDHHGAEILSEHPLLEGGGKLARYIRCQLTRRRPAP